MIGKITSVAVIGDKRLELAWDDAHVAPVDLADVIASHKALAPLKKKSEFARVSVSADGWSLEWPSGVDFGAQQLRWWADQQAGKVASAPPKMGWPWFESDYGEPFRGSVLLGCVLLPFVWVYMVLTRLVFVPLSVVGGGALVAGFLWAIVVGDDLDTWSDYAKAVLSIAVGFCLSFAIGLFWWKVIRSSDRRREERLNRRIKWKKERSAYALE